MKNIKENWFYKQGYLIGQIETANNWKSNAETREYRAQVRERILETSQFARVECMQALAAGMKAGRNT